MDQATLIKGRAVWTWDEFVRRGGAPRGAPAALPLKAMLEDLAERVFHLTVVEDDALTATNVEGVFDRDSGVILFRPGLAMNRAIFVIAHETGHCALDHPLQRIEDTAADIDPKTTPDDLSVERLQRVTGMDLSAASLTALRGYNQRDVYEMQANAFATELLAPSGLLHSIMRKEPATRVEDLAARLEIPVSLVRVGLAQALFSPRRAAAPPATSRETTLDSEQKRAVDCPTPALIIAGPGAGKTRVLVARYARLVAEGVPPRRILALTFANKAAGEMRERLAAMVPEEHAASVEVVTFHAFGLQLLQQYGQRIGLRLPLRLITPMDALLLFRRRAARMRLEALDDLPRVMETLRRMLDAIARAKEENAGPDRWEELARIWTDANPDEDVPEWAGDGTALYREYQAMLRRNGLLDYGDLQMEALRLFAIPAVAEEIRERYRYVLVDEFQDINFVSGQLVRALDGGRGVVWAVGDPRQGIYGFRGASPVNLTRFRTAEYYPDARVEKLTTNYRSVPDIVRAGMAVPVPLPADEELVPPMLRAERGNADPKPAVMAARLRDGGEEMCWIASRIRDLQNAGRSLSDIVVLVRANRHAARAAAALTEASIPHRWGGPIQDRPVFRVLMSALLLAADDTAGIAGLTTLSPIDGIPPDISLSEVDRRLLFADGRGRRRASQLLEMAFRGEIDGLSEYAVGACRALHRIASALSVTARPHHNLCVYLFEHSLWLRTLLSEKAQERNSVRAVLATVGQILDLSAGFAAQREALARSAGSSQTFSDEEPDQFETETTTAAYLAYLQAALQSGDLGVSNELDIEADAVSIITAHRSKGLEWPVVFIPFCTEGQFPGKERVGDLPIPIGLIATDDADTTAAQLREEACLFYVAVTRARDRLFLSSAETYGVRTKGPVSSLCQAVITTLEAGNRIILDDVTEHEAATATRAAEAAQSWIPYTVPPTLHEYDLSLYRECPRRFLYQAVYGIGDSDSAFLAFHRSVYRAAREAAQGPPPLRERFESLWEDAGPPADHWQTPLLRRMAERLIERMETAVPAVGDKSYRQEKALQIVADDGDVYNIRFAVDEVCDRSDGQRYFWRHKQASHLPKNPPDDPRLTLYAMAAEQEGPGIDVGFYYPQIDQTLSATIGKVKKANLRAAIVRAIGGIRRGEMGAKPGEACRRCPYSLICDRGGGDAQVDG